jgi:aquaporin Z
MVARAVKVLLLLLTAGLVARAFWRAEIVEVVAIELAVSDTDRSVAFFTDVLEFELVEIGEGHARLSLGEEELVLRERRGVVRPEHSNELSFQHIAIVVTDMDAAFGKLQGARVRLIGGGPQLLPAWNRDVAGIRALYFRDPDGNPLELLELPSDKGAPRWHLSQRLFAGIDHTAIVVASTRRAVALYRDHVGLTLAGDSLNFGAEQEALSGVPQARVRVTALRGARGPGVELLEYESGLITGGATGMPAWRIHLAAGPANAFCRSGATRDADGHSLACDRRRDPWYAYAWEALRQHWSRYLMEGAQLGIFMIVALYLTILLEHPGSSVSRAFPSAAVRRVIMGLGIGLTVVGILYSDWATQSGGHFNTAVTLSFLGAGRFQPWDAAFYLPAQLLGGWLGLYLASLPLRRAAAHERVKFVVTEPGPGGERAALLAELIISFWLLFSLRLVYQSEALRDFLPWFAGLNLLLFIVFEAPYSGMSLNPARTVASALEARSGKALWLYFVAPIWAMHLAMVAAGALGN